MIAFRNIPTILLVLLISFALVSCSEDDDIQAGPSEGLPKSESALGDVNLNISTDSKGQREGIADFDQQEVGTMRTWEITMQDYSPQTFTLKIMQMSTTEQVSAPAPGTYEIGNVIRDSNVYGADLTIIENQDLSEAQEYSTVFAQSGTLTISTSNEENISGTMEFTAYQYDYESLEILSTITVSGSFTAKPKYSITNKY